MRWSLFHSTMVLLYLTLSISCYPYLESAIYTPPSSFATGVKEKAAPKTLLRQILALKTSDYALKTDRNRGQVQEILRSWRNCWLFSFLTDLWINVMEFFPRAAIYAFVISSAIISFLFCVTILVGNRNH